MILSPHPQARFCVLRKYHSLVDWEPKIPKPKPGFLHRKAGSESTSLPLDLPFQRCTTPSPCTGYPLTETGSPEEKLRVAQSSTAYKGLLPPWTSFDADNKPVWGGGGCCHDRPHSQRQRPRFRDDDLDLASNLPTAKPGVLILPCHSSLTTWETGYPKFALR